MSEESVRSFFTDRGLKDPVFNLPESGATVELAAATIGIEPAYIAKTLSFLVGDKAVLVVARGDARIDNKKFKQFFKVKAKMLDADKVLAYTGHPVGGVCPFGLSNPLEIYIDISIKDFEYVYPAAGSNLTALKISPAAIQELTNGSWIDICTSTVENKIENT